MLVTHDIHVHHAPSPSNVSARYQQCCQVPDLQCCCHTPCHMPHRGVPPWQRSRILACGSRCLAEGGRVWVFLFCRCPKAACRHRPTKPAQRRRGVASAAGHIREQRSRTIGTLLAGCRLHLADRCVPCMVPGRTDSRHLVVPVTARPCSACCAHIQSHTDLPVHSKHTGSLRQVSCIMFPKCLSGRTSV
jgi:hypothetical protein